MSEIKNQGRDMDSDVKVTDKYTDRQLAIVNCLVSLAYSSLGFSLFLQKYFKFVYGVVEGVKVLTSVVVVLWTGLPVKLLAHSFRCYSQSLMIMYFAVLSVSFLWCTASLHNVRNFSLKNTGKGP